MGAYYHHRATGSAALAYTFAPNRAALIHEVRLHLSAGGAAENLTGKLDAGDGAAYDAVLFAETTSSLTDVSHKPATPYIIKAGDEVDFALANSNSRTWGIEVIYSLL